MKPTKYFSSKHEKMVADCLGWKVVPGSGARNFHPGDVVSERFLGECKTHVSEQTSIVFYRDIWEKIYAEATSQLKVPVLFVDDGTQVLNHTWCLFPIGLIPAWASDKFYNCQAHVLYPELERDRNINIHLDPLKARKVLKDYSVPDRVNFISLNWGTDVMGLLPLNQFAELLEFIDNL